MLNRMIVALLSTIVFSFVFSMFMSMPTLHRQPGTWYEPFLSKFIFYLVVSGVVHVIAGIPCSVLIDKFVKTWLPKLITYLIAGLVVGITSKLVLVALSSGPFIGMKTVFAFGSYGSIAALIYYLLLTFVHRITGKISYGRRL